MWQTWYPLTESLPGLIVPPGTTLYKYRVPSNGASSTIFNVFGMTQLGIEHTTSHTQNRHSTTELLRRYNNTLNSTNWHTHLLWMANYHNYVNIIILYEWMNTQFIQLPFLKQIHSLCSHKGVSPSSTSTKLIQHDQTRGKEKKKAPRRDRENNRHYGYYIIESDQLVLCYCQYSLLYYRNTW